MMEQAIYNAIWNMLASDYGKEDIKIAFNLIDIEELVDEVADKFDKE